jgi:hypothetical protein
MGKPRRDILLFANQESRRMSSGSRLLGFASMAALVAGLTVPAFAQATGTPPSTMPVPNSGTQIKCNPNGTATVTSGPNAETSTNNNVPGTPVTQVNPTGSGTTTTQTPTMTKGTNAATATQCPKTPQPQQTMPQQNTAPAAPQNTGTSNMDALNNNPNGPNWLDKFNRPTVSNTTMKTKKHHKRASGGGGGH